MSWSGMSGLSRPHSARTAAIFAWVRYWLRRSTRSGEPGIIRNRMKLRRTIAMIVTVAWTTRRAR
jgi:hypothetical protein